MAGVSTPEHITLTVAGAAATDAVRVQVPYASRILAATVASAATATVGNTVVDINVDGVSAFTAKPTILANASEGASVFAPTNGSVEVPALGIVSIDVDSAGTTPAPGDIAVTLVMEADTNP